LITVHNFSDGLVNPVLGYVISCLGAFLGLRCVTRGSYYQGLARARWLAIAATAIGATGIWAMHFIAMLGFTIPGQQISYNVPVTIASMLIAIAVVGVGLFIVGFGNGRHGRDARIPRRDARHAGSQRRVVPAAAGAGNLRDHLRPDDHHQPVTERGRDQGRRRVSQQTGNLAAARGLIDPSDISNAIWHLVSDDPNQVFEDGGCLGTLWRAQTSTIAIPPQPAPASGRRPA
jgi:Bacterial signalling protein N terminal repeat